MLTRRLSMAIMTLAALTLCASVSHADNDVNWSSTSGHQVFDHLGTTPLSPGGDGVGYLVQLIYAGGNGTPDLANEQDAGSDGYLTTSGDDVFSAYTWVGAGFPGPQQPGRFTQVGYNNTRPNGSVYFIRAWEYAADSAGTGDRAITESDWYGDSELFSITGNNTPISSIDYFYLTSNFNTDLQVIPEPGTMCLLALGMAAAGMVRRAKKS